MQDDLDDLLRRAMKDLVDQVPSGYFEDFPNRTLMRLEDSSMHDEPKDALGASSSADSLPAAAPKVTAAPAAPASVPPAAEAKPRDEDSGLHDIRSLASSQRMRISSKRSSQNPIADDELLAATSGSWKAVALPEPAKMISLPELADLPPASEVKEPEPERRPERRTGRESKQKIAAAAAQAAEAAPKPREVAAAAVEQPSVTPITAAKPKPKPAPAAGQGGSRNKVLAIAGIGLAAAAGAVIFVSTQGNKETAAPVEAPAAPKADMALPELQRMEQRAPAPAAIAAPEPAMGSAVADEPKPEPVEPDKGKAPPPPEKPTKSSGQYVPNVVEEPKPTKKKVEEPVKKPDPGDPDFDKLLKEAGYQEKKDEGPKLEKKSLSGDDIKKGMNGVAGKVAACYAGQQGTAAVRLTVAPTGQVQKVTVTGEFAGTPVGACVEAAVQGATFPPWDGGPQSVNYSYLLAE